MKEMSGMKAATTSVMFYDDLKNSEVNDRSSNFVASNTRMVRICVSSPPYDESKLFLFDFDPDLDLRSGEE